MKSESNSALSLTITQAKALKLLDIAKQHCNKDQRMTSSMQLRVGSCILKVVMPYMTSRCKMSAVLESRKSFCSEGSKRTLCPSTHASHCVICDRNRIEIKLILLN